MPLVSIINESDSGPIRLTVNHDLPPCGEIKQGEIVDLPEQFYQAALHSTCLKVTLHDPPAALQSAAPESPIEHSAFSAPSMTAPVEFVHEPEAEIPHESDKE